MSIEEEAKELRDHEKRYRGLGTRKAVANICGPIAMALAGCDFVDQDALDRALIELDGTPDKSRLGANTILAAANALLLKLSQIGTLTEAQEAHSIARAAGWQISISARSGETEDHWLADLAVGWSGDFTKVGSITQSERLAKYNRLLRIQRDFLS